MKPNLYPSISLLFNSQREPISTLFLDKIESADPITAESPTECIPVAHVYRRVALGQASYQLRIAFVPNKGPAFLVAPVLIIRRCCPILDQRFGVLKVTINCLYGVCDAGFLLSYCQPVIEPRDSEYMFPTFRICSPSTFALLIIRSLCVASHNAREKTLTFNFFMQIPTPRSSRREPKKN